MKKTRFIVVVLAIDTPYFEYFIGYSRIKLFKYLCLDTSRHRQLSCRNVHGRIGRRIIYIIIRTRSGKRRQRINIRRRYFFWNNQTASQCRRFTIHVLLRRDYGFRSNKTNETRLNIDIILILIKMIYVR